MELVYIDTHNPNMAWNRGIFFIYTLSNLFGKHSFFERIRFQCFLVMSSMRNKNCKFKVFGVVLEIPVGIGTDAQYYGSGPPPPPTPPIFAPFSSEIVFLF
jgi:hypothetical protein